MMNTHSIQSLNRCITHQRAHLNRAQTGITVIAIDTIFLTKTTNNHNRLIEKQTQFVPFNRHSRSKGCQTGER